MTLETPFRLMWTDEEGDNICFSTDEELAQALKFVKGQENQLFKVIIKTPQVQQEQAQAAREARARNNPQASLAACGLFLARASLAAWARNNPQADFGA